MRHLPLLATAFLLLAIPLGSAGLTRPGYWEGDGLVGWTVPMAAPTNHGGSLEAQVECFGTLRLQSYGPILRDGASASAGPLGVTVDEGGHHIYPTRIEVIPDRGAPECVGMEFRLDATHSGLDLFDETFHCAELGCSTLTLTWDEEQAGALAIRAPRAGGLPPLTIDATIGVTFAV